MKGSKKNDEIAPNSQDAQELAKKIRSEVFYYLLSFADLMNRYVDIEFRRDNISRLRHATLDILITRTHPVTPTHMSKLMFRSKHSMTKIIDSLEKEGFIRRERDLKDRRLVWVKVTPAGLQYIKQSLSTRARNIQSIMSCLDSSEIATLMNYIGRLRKRLIEKTTNNLKTNSRTG